MELMDADGGRPSSHSVHTAAVAAAVTDDDDDDDGINADSDVTQWLASPMT